MRLPARFRVVPVAALGIVAALGPARTALAQRPEVAWRPAPYRARLQAPPIAPTPLHFSAASLADSAVIPRTHWLEGGLIGGGVMGALGAAFVIGMCSYDGPCGYSPPQYALAGLGGFVFGGLIGFVPGALIGGQFPKRPAAQDVPPPN